MAYMAYMTSCCHSLGENHLISAFQQGRMAPVLGENALDGMPASESI